jgi:uncharacterized membrane protein YGL010W
MLDEYASSHQNPFNKKIHIICVPTIMFSILGLLWAIPSLDIMGEFNWASFVSIFVMLYYLVLSRKYFFLMIPVIGLMYFGNYFLALTHHLISISVFVFIASWIFQMWGHKVEGKKPSFLKDLLFLLIGPIWVVKSVLNINDTRNL